MSKHPKHDHDEDDDQKTGTPLPDTAAGDDKPKDPPEGPGGDDRE